MIVIFLLLPLSIVIAACFLTAFIWAVWTGQYEDTCTPSMRLLLEEQKASVYKTDNQTDDKRPSSDTDGRELAPITGAHNPVLNTVGQPSQSVFLTCAGMRSPVLKNSELK